LRLRATVQSITRRILGASLATERHNPIRSGRRGAQNLRSSDAK
jgi:hypothetical protein